MDILQIISLFVQKPKTIQEIKFVVDTWKSGGQTKIIKEYLFRPNVLALISQAAQEKSEDPNFALMQDAWLRLASSADHVLEMLEKTADLRSRMREIIEQTGTLEQIEYEEKTQ